MSIPITTVEFRAAFEAFVDTKETDVQRHIDAAAPFFDTGRWDKLYAQGIGNYVAHQIVIEACEAFSAGGNDRSGTTVGGVNIQRSTEILMMEARDPMTSTVYGKRYRYLSRLVGFGAISV